MKLLWFSSIPSQLYKPLDSEPDNPLKFNPKVQLLRSSKPCNAAKTDENENGQNSVKTLPLPSHVKSITSTSNPFVKHCLKLRQSSSYRHSHGSVILVGSTPIRSLRFLSLYRYIAQFSWTFVNLGSLWSKIYVLECLLIVFLQDFVSCFWYVLWVFVQMLVLVCDSLWFALGWSAKGWNFSDCS